MCSGIARPRCPTTRELKCGAGADEQRKRRLDSCILPGVAGLDPALAVPTGYVSAEPPVKLAQHEPDYASAEACMQPPAAEEKRKGGGRRGKGGGRRGKGKNGRFIAGISIARRGGMIDAHAVQSSLPAIAIIAP